MGLASHFARHYFEISCIEHDNKDSYWCLGGILLDLCEEQYDGDLFIPGHSCLPKALYWYRKAAIYPDAHQDDAIQVCKKYEDIVKGHCANCKILKEYSPVELKACSICKAAYYCGKECQTNHWKAGHKIDCIKRNYPGVKRTSHA